MSVQTGAVGAAPPADPPSSTSPPGDPPEGFGEVLGAQLERLGDSHTQSSTRTADAEGAREEGAAAEDRKAGNGQSPDPSAEAGLTPGQASSPPGQSPASGTPDPNAPEGSPASSGRQASTASGPVGEPQANLPEGQVAPGATAATAADMPEGQTVGGDAAPQASAPASRPAAPAVQLPAEPTHSTVKELAVVTPGRVGEQQDQLGDAVAKLDRPRAGQQGLASPGRTEQVPEGQGVTAARSDVKQDATSQAVGLAESRRGGTAGQQAGTTPDGQSQRQGASQLAAPPTAAAQPTAATDATSVTAKAEAPLRARARLGELADVAGTLIRVAARDGKTTARITLRPVELGEVEIRLRYHAGGVSADVVAESRQAAQLLTNASSELRKSLESQGLTVHWLDVRAGGDERGGWDELGQSGNGGPSDGNPGLGETDELTSIEASSLPLAAGAVDVLA